MQPTINVNRKPCNCPQAKRLSGLHDIDCASVPLLIPCDWPTSFTCEVALGKCSPECVRYRCASMRLGSQGHIEQCPARPIRVSCSITSSDGTWAGTEVTDVDNPHDHEGRWGAGAGDSFRAAIAACNERWALVKALLLGRDGEWENDPRSKGWNFRYQRDAVFTKICELTRQEEERIQTKQQLHEACSDLFPQSGVTISAPGDRESATYLSGYVRCLATYVGNLP